PLHCTADVAPTGQQRRQCDQTEGARPCAHRLRALRALPICRLATDLHPAQPIVATVDEPLRIRGPSALHERPVCRDASSREEVCAREVLERNEGARPGRTTEAELALQIVHGARDSEPCTAELDAVTDLRVRLEQQ